MKGKFYFRTLIRREADKGFGENDYVLGYIVGVKSVLCDNGQSYATVGINRGKILTTYCTDEQYQNFVEFIENRYPGLCVFYYVGSERK